MTCIVDMRALTSARPPDLGWLVVSGRCQRDEVALRKVSCHANAWTRRSWFVVVSYPRSPTQLRFPCVHPGVSRHRPYILARQARRYSKSLERAPQPGVGISGNAIECLGLEMTVRWPVQLHTAVQRATTASARRQMGPWRHTAPPTTECSRWS